MQNKISVATLQHYLNNNSISNLLYQRIQNRVFSSVSEPGLPLSKRTTFKANNGIWNHEKWESERILGRWPEYVNFT